MALYKYNTSGVFSEIKEKPFKLERDIQRMFETNMSEIMGLEMIKSAQSETLGDCVKILIFAS